MRNFEYKIMAYLELYHKFIEQNPIEGETQKYEVQKDYLTIIQTKIGEILERHRADYLERAGFVMNHNSTKSLVEFLHAYLNALNRFRDKIEMSKNQKSLEFVCETLNNS